MSKDRDNMTEKEFNMLQSEVVRETDSVILHRVYKRDGVWTETNGFIVQNGDKYYLYSTEEINEASDHYKELGGE